jgi:hypothetical protein
MAKSIEEIMSKIESERSQRLNEEMSKIDDINKQRDIQRKEWLKEMRIYENLSFNQPQSSLSGGIKIIQYITIVDTIWIYPQVDVDLAFEEFSLTHTVVKNNNNYEFETLQDIIDFYELTYNKTTLSQPIGNVGYSLGVGTILESRRSEINLITNGITVVKWLLLQQLTNQSELPSGGDSPDGTIGYGAVYVDWDLDGILDLPSVPGIGLTDPLRFQIYNQV